MASQDIYDKVTEHYSAALRTSGAAYGSAVAKSFGYSEEELADAPEGSNLGLSCGNPLALASIKEVCHAAPLAHSLFSCHLTRHALGRGRHRLGQRSWLRCLPSRS